MNVISLFAGCGGLDLGFEKAGYNVIWANEYDVTICDTYKYNHPNTTLLIKDIRTISCSDIPDCDGIIGGPPCQSWSEGGKGLGIEDPRGQLFLDYIRIVEGKKPKFFLIENVAGLLEERHNDALNFFLSKLTGAGYFVYYELLNASDYRIPQDRFRVFFVGIRNDIKQKFNFPDSTCNNPITLKEAIGDIIEQPRTYNRDKVLSENNTRLNHDVYTGPYDSKYMSRNRVRGWNETSFTIQAQARNIPQHPQAPKMSYFSSNKRCFVTGQEHLYRRLSVRECARIQTFPDNFKFIYTDIIDGYKMVGNAVPPRLAYLLAIQLRKTLENEQLTQNANTSKYLPVSSLPTDFCICNNIISKEEISVEKRISSDKVVVALVKNDAATLYTSNKANYYYTGKNIPVELISGNYKYFMPYIKGKGIRDLYLIKQMRIGTKSEVISNCIDKSSRIIIEISYVKNLFNDYLPFHLHVMNTFSFKVLSELVKVNESED